jgi:hypothetical protein
MNRDLELDCSSTTLGATAPAAAVLFANKQFISSGSDPNLAAKADPRLARLFLNIQLLIVGEAAFNNIPPPRKVVKLAPA